MPDNAFILAVCLELIWTYSNPLSVLNPLTLFLVYFSTAIFHSLNKLNVSYFVFSKYIPTFLDRSPIMIMKYLAPPSVGALEGPHRSECTYSSISNVVYFAVLNFILLLFLSIHFSQKSSLLTWSFPSGHCLLSSCFLDIP